MKVIYPILFLFSNFIAIAQVDSSYYFKVQAFISPTKKIETKFFSAPNGIVLDSVKNPGTGYWICATIDSQSGDWANLEVVYVCPSRDSLKHLYNSWIPINELWLNLSNDGAMIYAEPDLSAAHTTVSYHLVNILAVKNNWAKVQFKQGDNNVIGWVSKESQCGFPWTSCTY